MYDEGLGNAIALQRDGRIVVVYAERVGEFTIDTKIARYESDGSIDASFGSGGVVDVDPSYYDEVYHDRRGGRLIMVTDSRALDIVRMWL